MLPSRYSYSIYSSFLTPEEVEEVRDMIPPFEEWNLTNLMSSKEYVNRALLDRQKYSSVYSLLNTYLSRVGLMISPSSHISPRLYQVGSFMDWHVDFGETDLDKEKKDVYECVVTLGNTSDIRTYFKDKDTGKITSHASNAGDLIILCRHGISHSVSKCTTGERLILKLTCVDRI